MELLGVSPVVLELRWDEGDESNEEELLSKRITSSKEI
jgi:hypothetical protein